MEKALLQNFTGDSDANEDTAIVKDADENKALTALMQDMRRHLQEAAKDLLQPRKEAVDKLLKKVLH